MISEHYLDHAAGTPPFEEVAALAAELSMAFPGNPSGLHRKARAAASIVEEARERIAALCGASPSGVVFTSGGTEADNLAIKGIVLAKRKEGLDHVVVSAIEHHAVLDSAKWLQSQGIRLDLAPVDENGAVDVEKLEILLTPATALVSVMSANNETGAIQPLAEIGEVVRERSPRAILHTDACQAFSSREVTLHDLGADALTLSSHKIGGTQGAGALVLADGVGLERISHGGGQELGRRAGTHNVAAIASFGLAAKLAATRRSHFVKHTSRLRDELEKRIVEALYPVVVNAARAERLPHISNVTIPGMRAEDLLVLLDRRGVFASSGSACSSGTAQPSHVLLAMGAGPEAAHCTLRFSFGHTSTDEDVEAAASALSEAVETLGKRGQRSAQLPAVPARAAR